MAAITLFDKETSLPFASALGSLTLLRGISKESATFVKTHADLWAEAKEIVRKTLEQIHSGAFPSF